MLLQKVALLHKDVIPLQKEYVIAELSLSAFSPITHCRKDSFLFRILVIILGASKTERAAEFERYSSHFRALFTNSV